MVSLHATTLRNRSMLWSGRIKEARSGHSVRRHTLGHLDGRRLAGAQPQSRARKPDPAERSDEIRHGGQRGLHADDAGGVVGFADALWLPFWLDTFATIIVSFTQQITSSLMSTYVPDWRDTTIVFSEALWEFMMMSTLMPRGSTLPTLSW
jgi:hypothetical protein